MSTEQQDTDSQHRCTHRDDEARDGPGLKEPAAPLHGGAEKNMRRQKLLERILLRQGIEQQAPASEVPADLPAIDQHKSKKQPSKKLLAPAVGDLLLQMVICRGHFRGPFPN